jgi:hypothetical protein
MPFLTTALLIVAIAATPRLALADPIEITSGTLVLLPRGGLIHLEGERGLVLDVRGSGRATIWDCDLFAVCAPGSAVTLDTGWVGSDIGGQATLDGETWPVALGTQTTGAVAAIFSGSILMPAFSGEELVSATAPFTFFGRLSYPSPFGVEPRPPVDLTGRGTATVDLTWISSQGGWDVRGATYVFAPLDAEPIPEPGTLILVGSGLAALVGRHRARRARHSQSALNRAGNNPAAYRRSHPRSPTG